MELWDKDILFSDDLIGMTYIDVEDRFFSELFRSYNNKTPIEQRRLSHPSTELCQG